MIKRALRSVVALLLMLCSASAVAGYRYSISVMQTGWDDITPDCDTISAKLGKAVECTGLAEAVDHSVRAHESGFFSILHPDRLGPQQGVVNSTGNCLAGRAAGTADVGTHYVNVTTLAIVSTIVEPLQVTGVVSSCKVRAVDKGGCFVWNSKAVNGIAPQTCTIYLQETGEIGGADSMPPGELPAYSGGGTGGGGGTTPGDGGGTTPGDGGGTTPGGGGTTPGGGGTTPGDGGGGTTPGGGGSTPGTGGGDGEAHCGAPGQPACSINEGSTPTGIGGLLDGLMKLVDGLGEGRQSGIDDAKSDAGKNTDVPLFAIGIPRAECVNPSISEPFSGRVWTIEICKYITMVSIAFEAFWIFAFAIAVMSLVSKATQKPVA